MNKPLATAAIVAGLLSVGSPAQAFGVNYSYFANKPYMGCLKYMGSISKNEQERAEERDDLQQAVRLSLQLRSPIEEAASVGGFFRLSLRRAA